jgi:hypothetical protein
VHFAAVRVGVLVLDVIVRVLPMGMRVGRITVGMFVGVHSAGHALMLARLCLKRAAARSCLLQLACC